MITQRELNKYPHHFKIYDYLKKHGLYKIKEELFKTLLDKIKSESCEKQFKNNIWHESLHIFLNSVELKENFKSQTNRFICNINYIYLFLENNQNIRAQKLFEKLNDNDSEISEAYACLGYALSRLHPSLYGSALECFEHSVRINPQNGKVLLQQAKLTRKLSDDFIEDEYKEYLNRALKLLPEDEEIKAEYLEIGEWRITEPIAKITNTSVLLKIVNYYIRQDQYKEARSLLHKINSIRAQPMSFYFLALISHEKQWMYILEAVKIDKLNPFISFGYACYLINEHKFVEAQQQLICTKNNTISIPLKDSVNMMLYFIQNYKTHSLQSMSNSRSSNLTKLLPREEILAILQKDIDVKCKERAILIRCFLKFAFISNDNEICQYCFKQLLALKSKITLQELEDSFSYDICFFTEYFSDRKELEIFRNAKFGLRIIDNNTEDFYGQDKIKTQLKIFHQSLIIVICVSKDFSIPNFFIENILQLGNRCKEIMVLSKDKDIKEDTAKTQLKSLLHIKFQDDYCLVQSFFQTLFSEQQLIVEDMKLSYYILKVCHRKKKRYNKM